MITRTRVIGSLVFEKEIYLKKLDNKWKDNGNNNSHFPFLAKDSLSVTMLVC